MTARSPIVSGIADALFTKVQQRVLSVLFGNHSRSFYANELIDLAGSGSGAVQRELAHLEAAGLVTVKRVGNQKHYQANSSAPVVEELCGLVLKTSGLVDVIRAALAPVAAQIDSAFVFGSVAKANDNDFSNRELYWDLVLPLLNPVPPQLHNTDGDPLSMQRLIFAIDSPAAAFSALKGLAVGQSEDELLQDAEYTAGGELRRIAFNWTKRGNSRHKGWETTVLARIDIGGTQLTAEVNSTPRAMEFKRLMSARLGEKARYRVTEIQSMERLLDFDIVPKKLTLTLGTRYYRINTTSTGFSAESYYCMDAGLAPCTANQPPSVPNGVVSNNETSEHLNVTYSGFRSRANLSWKVTDDALLYYTWSQGFRPGGFNRGSLIRTPPGQDYTFQSPAAYGPDTLVNNEVGWKTQWMDHRFEFNGAVYRENWDHVQVELFEPCCFGNVSFLVNGPSYRVRGQEMEAIARPLHGLSVVAAAAWNSGSMTSAPLLYDTAGNPITSIQNPFGAPGSPPSQSPPFSGNLRVRYEFELGTYSALFQAAGTHQAHSYSATGNATTFDQAAFSTYDASCGVAKDAWTAHLYVQNLTDTRANLYENNSQAINAITVNRPRTAGVRFGYRF